MFNSDIILTFDYQNEHNFEHNIAVMTNFKTPKIYTAKGDLNKRWYVYFSFKNPKTGKFQRMKNIYGIANKFKTKEDRLYVLTTYRRNLIKLLKEGFNPFENNSELIAKKKQENNAVIQTKIEVPVENSSVKRNEEKTEVSMTIKKAIDFALTIKEKTVSERTFKDYSSKSKKFINWLKKEHPKVKTIDQLTKKEVQQYLNYVLSKTTARNRNNYRVEISSLIQVLVDNDIIKSNMVKSIKILKTRPERNKTYSKDKLEEIYSFLENNDPHLLLFIKFISYNLLRPIEVCRVKIKDINLKQKTISFKAKNKVLKTKTIPNILLKELPDLSNCNQDELLFTPHNIGGKWDANEKEEDLILAFLENNSSSSNIDFTNRAIKALSNSSYLSFVDILYNRTNLDLNSAIDPNNNTIGGYDTTPITAYNPNQDSWPFIGNVIPITDFVGWGESGLERDCMTYAKEQLRKAGYQISNYGDAGQTYQVYTEQNGINLDNTGKGVAYLISALHRGIPVIVGVNYEPGSVYNKNTDNSTDHFVVIVGMGTDSNGKNYFNFFDNASFWKPYYNWGASLDNKFYFDSATGSLIGSSRTNFCDNVGGVYQVTQIRKSKPL